MQVPGTALLVEDDPGIAATLRSHLTRAGFTVYEARSERDAVQRVEEIAPDVVILDLALENGGGMGACRRIRELPSVGDVPVLVLSAESDVTAKLALFELGADDVVASTCDPTELLARVRAILRRGADRQTIRRIGPLRIALATGDAWLADFLPKVFASPQYKDGSLAVLESLDLAQVRRAYPGLTSRTVLDRRPDQDRDVSSNVTEVLVARLRRKIEAAGGGVEIHAVRRSGYVLRPLTAAAVAPY